MIIEEICRGTTFGDLEEGDVFVDSGTYYFKIPPCEGSSGYNYNSYNLEINDYCYFSCDRNVTPVRAKLVIE